MFDYSSSTTLSREKGLVSCIETSVNCYVVKLYLFSLGCISSLNRCHTLLGFLTLLTMPS